MYKINNDLASKSHTEIFRIKSNFSLQNNLRGSFTKPIYRNQRQNTRILKSYNFISWNISLESELRNSILLILFLQSVVYD